MNFGKSFSICDGAVLKIYLDHKIQWPQEGFNCEFLEHDTIAVWN